MSPGWRPETEKLNQLLLECRLKITRIQVSSCLFSIGANDLMKIIILGLGGFMPVEARAYFRRNNRFPDLFCFTRYAIDAASGRIATIYQRGIVGIQSAQNYS